MKLNSKIIVLSYKDIKDGVNGMIDNETKCEKCFHHTICEKATCIECQGSYCDECELYNIYGGNPQVEGCEKFVDADLINRQKEQIEGLISGQETLQNYITKKDAEIERLQKENTELDGANILLTVTLKNAKSEAVKEFAERLKERKYQTSDWSHGEHPYVVEESDIDEVLEEMAMKGATNQ